MDESNTTPQKGASSAAMWVILAVIIVIALGALYYYMQKTEPSTNSNVVVNTKRATNINSTNNTNSEPLDTSAWPRYSNDKYGYAFKHPDNWTVRTDDVSGGSFGVQNAVDQIVVTPTESTLDFPPASECSITVFDNPSSKSLPTWIADSQLYVTAGEGLHLSSQVETVKGSINGLLVDEGGPNFTKTQSFYFADATKVVRFGYYVSGDIGPKSELKNDSAICSTILSTLSK